jgi:mRNA-degrading endonuclease toxin of MazEF toxin-antitoxin module
MTEPKRPRVIGRNDPCPCGSEIKYKKCCLPLGPDAYGNQIQRQSVPVVLEGTRTEIL